MLPLKINVDGIKGEKLGRSQRHGDIKKQDSIRFWQLSLSSENKNKKSWHFH